MTSAPRSKSTRLQRRIPHAALLRGINVGGKNKVSMAALAEVFTRAGCTDVRTYIQSGNVVFVAAQASARRISSLVAQQIRERFGFDAPVVIRTAEELRRIAASNPFLRSEVDMRSLHVAFLANAPDARRVAGLDPTRSPGDDFQVVGREVYLHLPNGVARTKLTNRYFDTALATVSTIRNWRTVLKLVELAEQVGVDVEDG